MKCPFCSHPDTQVVETRMSEDNDSVRRRRRCSSCDRRFTTYERAEMMLPAIIKKDGRRMDYDRNKLQASMALALRKRGISMSAIDAAINRIEEILLSNGAREVPSGQLGELVMAELRQLDKVGFIRFASVYLSLQDIAEFRKLLDTASDGKTEPPALP